jgi:hypothetical protein
MHKTTARFWKCFEKLPIHIQNMVDENFELPKNDSKHPSLHFKKVGKKLWSVRIGLNYHALAFEDDESFIWVWIGTHYEYNRMLKI